AGGPDVDARRLHHVFTAERGRRGVGEVPLAQARLHARVAVDAPDDRSVEAIARREGEPAPVDARQVDLPWAPGVREPQEVLGGIDDVARYAEHAVEDVGRAAGEARERGVRAGEAIGCLVHRAVAAEGDDDVVSLLRGLAAERRGLPAALGAGAA